MSGVSVPARILIVDDHEAVRRGIRSLLVSSSSWTVCGEAADGLEAIEKARLLHPDVILMDVAMPMMDGWEATKAIHEFSPETEFIILSQNDSPVGDSQASTIGARAFIGKFDLGRDLLPTLERVLTTHVATCRPTEPSTDRAWLPGGGQMGELIRSFDWTTSLLGPVDRWPESLKTAVRICVGSRNPIVLWWGRSTLSQFYNDAYISFLGEKKHPAFLGRSARECWIEIWGTIGPMLEQVFTTGQATWSEDLLLTLNRNLPREEGYFTFSYSPLWSDDAGTVEGVFCACYETTGRVIGDRRLRTLRDLGHTVSTAKTAEEACQSAAGILESNPADIPFGLLYLVEDDGQRVHRAAMTGFMGENEAAPEWVDLTSPDAAAWPLKRILETGSAEFVSDLPRRFEHLPGGAWPEPPESALIIPISHAGQPGPTGFLVAGLSPRRIVDADYRSFFDLIVGHVSTAISNARAYDAERKRSEALAELDRAKTTFFSNVSHEFRTPLTLLLGPLEDALANAHGILPLGAAKDLAVSHRNALRLLKLVNTLLDFARIEAGRVQASYEPTNLPILTSELASNFRSACEKAGLRLIVDCAPLTEPVFVDRDMWEKIVLNLLSNAFKFTHKGQIELRLTSADRKAVLTVRDTGVGVPADELPNMFERFHRVKDSRGRTHEGTGIGLALVHELVKLHGGTVAVQSEFGKGSVFTITIPFGSQHLDPQRVGKPPGLSLTNISSSAYVEEALRWLPDSEDSDLFEPPTAPRTAATSASVPRPLVLWADDNTDMRAYVSRLLHERFEVQSVNDGEAALAAARTHPPDLVLADVMMPKMDGFGLLRALRADPKLREIPVILLSARAGQESRIEGIQAGADDYLTKPFSARELMARVETHVQMAAMRREAKLALQAGEERYRELSQMLDQEVRARTAELEKRNADVLQKTEQLREISQRLLTIQENERRQIARELHDSAGNILTALGLTLANARTPAKRTRAELDKTIEDSEQLLSDLASELRTMSHALHPPLLEEGGLASAVRWLVTGLSDRSGMEIKLSIPSEFPRLPAEMELAMFRVIQECLTNAYRHSGSRSAAIRLFCEAGFVNVEVRDHGKGIAPETMAEVKSQACGVGIRGMHERLRYFGGDLAISSNNRGTKVAIRVPAPVVSSIAASLQAESQIKSTLPS